MSYFVELPDGRNVEFPDSVSKDKAAEIIRQQLGGPKAAPSAPSSLKDIATSFGLGAVGSTKALTDVAGADNAASRALGEASESLSRAYTPQRQAEIERRQQLIKEAEKSGSTWEEIKANLGAVAEAPLQSAAQGLGSIAPYALTGGVGSAAKLLPTTVRTINTLMGAAQGAGAVKGSIYDAVYGKLKEEGADDTVARQQAVAAQEYLGKNAGQIALGTGIGAAAGRYGVESLLTPGAAKAAEANLGRRVGTALVGEMPLEGVQGGQERLAANVALQNQGYNVPTFEGVGGQAAQEAAMAGLAAGPIAAVRSPAAEIQRKKDEEDKKLREERRLAEATELARKQTPEYAFGIEQKYLALEKQRVDLKAQKIKIDESSPTVAADKVFNKDLDKKIEELGKNEIAPLAKEYNTVKPLLDTIRKQAALDKISPEDAMMSYLGVDMAERGKKIPETKGRMAGALGQTPAFAEQPATTGMYVDEFGRVTDGVPAAPKNPVTNYAQEQVQAARESGQITLPDMADYLMQDPKMAAQVAAERPALPGFSNKDLTTLYGGVKLRLADIEKQGLAGAKAELAQRQADLSSQKLTEPKDQMAMFKASEEQVAEHAKTAESNFDYLDPIFEKAVAGKPPVVTVNPLIKPDDKAPEMRARIDKVTEDIAQAERDERQARGLKEFAAATEAAARREAARRQLESLSADGGEYAKTLIPLRQKQDTALAKLEETTQRLKSDETLGTDEQGKMASATRDSLAARAANLRAEFIKSSLEEAALHRRAAGKPVLTQDEAIKAASKLYDTVNDWVDRAATQYQPAQYEEQIVEPAQMRADKIVRPAVTKRVEIAPAVQGISPAEAKHFKARIAAVRDQLSEVSSTSTRVGSLLKSQFASTEAKKVGEAKGETATTLAGELRRHSEYTLTNLTKAMMRDVRGELRDVLEEARAAIEDKRVSRALLDAVDAQVERIMRGEDTGTMLTNERRVISEKRVVGNVPGKEGQTRFGVKRKFGDVAFEEERAPLTKYQQAIKDALAASAPTALEQKEAGQKALFPETEKDLGYIRMSPKNFANSPKIMEAWSALDKARAAAKRKADKDAIITNRSKAVATTISRLNDEIDRVKNDTKFFWTNTKQWTDADLARAYVGYPEIGNNPAEQALVDRYLADKGKGLTVDEKEQVAELLRQFNSKKMPEYQKHLKEAMQIVSQGGRLEDLDNQLLQTMQNANTSVRNQAAELRKELAVMRTAINQLRSISKTDRKDPLSKRINALEVKAEQAKSQYRERVEQLFKKAHSEMDAALAEILDPDIKNVKADLDKALVTLEKEKAELERVQKNVQEFIAREPEFESHKSEEANRIQRVAYEQFRYEEKKTVIENLEKQIKEQQDDLENLMDTRMNAHDSAAAVLQAITDKKVQALRDRIVDIETNVATMRGESVTAAEPGSRSELPALKYPFAAQKAEMDLKAAQAELKGAERQQTETVKEIKSQARQLEDIWREMWGGFGKRRVEGRVESLSSTERLRLDKLRDDAFAAEDRADDAYMRAQKKRVQLAQIDSDIADVVSELAGVEYLPDDQVELRAIVENGESLDSETADAIAKLSMLRKLTELEAQREVVEEGKPGRKQQAATVETTAKQSARTPFRTGDAAAQLDRQYQEMSREEQRAVNEAAQAARGTKAAPEPKPSTRRQGRMLDENIGLFDDFEFSRGVPTTGMNVKELTKELERGIGEKLLIGEEEFQGNRRLALYENPEEFMKANPQYEGKIPSDAKGFVDNGKAYLFANNIGEGHALGVLLHEVGVHIGFRNFFNENQYRALAGAVKTWAKKTDNSIEARVGKAALKRVEDAKTSAEHFDDELIAYAVEEAMNMGVRPDGVGPRSVAHNWLKMVVDAFKKALSKFGINPANLTAGDMVNFAYGCAQIELKGTWHGAGVEFDEFDHAHMGKGEGAQAFGWGTYRAQRKGIASGYKNVASRNLNDRQEREWLENPEVQAWIKQQEPKLKGTTLSELSDFSVEGKEGDVKYGIPYTYSGVLRYSLAHITELNAMGRLAGIDPKRYFRDFVNNLANDMEVQPEVYEHGFEEMYQGDGIAKNVARLYNFMKTFDGLEVPAKKEPPIPEPKPSQGALKRTLHLRPENEYLDYDRQAGKQSKYVMDRVADLFDGLDDAQQKAFLRSLAHIPNPNMPRGKDVYNAFSAAYELETPNNPRKADEITSKRLLAAGIAGNKFLDQSSRESYGTHNYVDFADKGEGAAIMGTNLEPVGNLEKGKLLFSRAATYNNDEARDAAEGFDKFVAKGKSTTEKVRAAAGGFLGLETQLVDRFAPLERISKTMDALKGSQMMYFLRSYDQRMHFTAQAVGNGALARVEKTRKDGQKEYVIESKPGASIKGVVQILKDAQPYVGNAEAVNRMFTAYMSAIRANNKGFASLSFSKDVTEQDLRKAEKFVNGNKELKSIFDDARREYNDYNRDMMEFLASTGAISEQTRKELTQENDYIPWYRESNGVAELMIGGESRIRIGSIAEQPYLHELVGGDKPILDFMTSSVQNTNMLVDMGLRNLATKEAVFELVDLKMAKIVGASSGPDIVKFKIDGEDKYAAVEGTKGIPGDLIVKGMEGIPTQMPAAFRILGMPSRLLRKAVTLSPMYAAKQLFRDSLAAPILSGANFMPVFGALKEINKPTKEILERRGIVGGQQFTGTNEDMTMILREITDGKPGWMSALAKAEAIGMEADALTRRAQYNSYIEQGLSEMEATLMALESMNFSKRGASPSMHIIASMIPFFNSQIQGLNVLYKAMTGQMPFNERLKIQEKMLQRGAMMAAGTLAYAAMMQDDDAYKDANPEQKYGNWFVRLPGVDQPVRIPVPFEVGYIFKALPEALYNTMVNEHGGEEAVKAFRHILLQTIPGGGSMPTINGIPLPIPIPQAAKPAIEAALGKSFYTERDILTSAEKSLLPEEQFRTNTSEAAKMVGRVTGTSPIILEQLVNGYTGTMGLAFLQAVSLGIPKGNTPEQATQRLSDMPIIGGAFQPNDAGGIVNATYDRFESAIKVQRTVDKLFEEGRQADANELLQKTGNEYAVGEVGDYFATQMKELTQYERAIQAMDMSGAEKREKLDEIKRLKKTLALSARQTAEEIARQ